MNRVRFFAFLTGISAFLAAAPLGAGAQELTGNSTRQPIVVELFSSQSCNMCVAATEYFSELAAREDIIALGWHVDYWNMRNTKRGRWTDPYSNAAYTDRQRAYNRNIRNRSSVYTPQIVIAGNAQAVGSSREKVGALIDDARASQNSTSIEATRQGGQVVFDVAASKNGGNAYLAVFKPRVKTAVTHGENAGTEFNDVNVVTSLHRLGVVRRMGAHLTAPAPKNGEHCALIVQEPGQGRIIAAAYCATS